MFSSPFIEERLYLKLPCTIYNWCNEVLVPFYRGAVVFLITVKHYRLNHQVLVPFYRGAVVFEKCGNGICGIEMFSSPFIEERLYLNMKVYHVETQEEFSSPFIEERLYFQFVILFFLLSKQFSSPFIEERLYLNYGSRVFINV